MRQLTCKLVWGTPEVITFNVCSHRQRHIGRQLRPQPPPKTHFCHISFPQRFGTNWLWSHKILLESADLDTIKLERLSTKKIAKQKNCNKRFFETGIRLTESTISYFQLQKHILLWKSARLHSWNHVQHNSLPKDLICLSLTLNLAINICLDYSGFHILWPVQACFLQGCIRQHFNVCKFIGWVDKYCIYRPNNISTNIEMTLLSKLCWLCKCSKIRSIFFII